MLPCLLQLGQAALPCLRGLCVDKLGGGWAYVCTGLPGIAALPAALPAARSLERSGRPSTRFTPGIFSTDVCTNEKMLLAAVGGPGEVGQ